MKRYSEYKDSGVKWIGEIPGHWDTPRIKSVAIFNPSKSTVNYQKVGYAPMDCIRCGNITAGIIDYKKLPTGLTYFENEDIVVAKVTPCFENGNIAIAKNLHNGCAYGSSELFVFRCYGVENRYLFYYMQDEKFKHKCCSTMTGTGGLKRISSSFIRNAFIPLPPLPEQEAIVTYLDTKVAKIDEYISIAEKKIAALEELKQTIIAEAVTRGIHKEVPMKDSGVKWIGMIPEHWKVLCLKYLSKIKGRIGYRGYTAADLVSEGEGAFVIGGKHINQCILNTESPDYISWDKYYESPEIMVSKGDIVMAQRGSLGKVALIDKEINEATINPSLVLIKDICCDASFLYFYLRSNSTLTLIELLNTATAVPMISQKQIEKMPIPLPPLPEQQEIVTYIEAKVANINQLCQAERSQIEKLKEYKQRLISDVVTGKVKVTND